MTITSYILIGVGALLIALLYLFISKYNQLNRDRNQIENAISSLDAIFIKRADLIPNLVSVVKQYMKFEEGTLEKITALRNQGSNANQAIEQAGNDAMKNLMIQVENYPELKANTQFTNLQYSWNEVEEQISAGRRYISSSITVYNNSITTFPSNVVANVFSFKMYEWQFANESQREAIQADKLFTS